MKKYSFLLLLIVISSCFVPSTFNRFKAINNPYLEINNLVIVPNIQCWDENSILGFHIIKDFAEKNIEILQQIKIDSLVIAYEYQNKSSQILIEEFKNIDVDYSEYKYYFLFDNGDYLLNDFGFERIVYKKYDSHFFNLPVKLEKIELNFFLNYYNEIISGEVILERRKDTEWNLFIGD